MEAKGESVELETGKRSEKQKREVTKHGILDAVGSHGKLEGKYLTFGIASERYGISILDVREIIGMIPVRPVPHLPDFMKGVINLRGKVIPIVDLRKRFNLELKEHDKNTRIVVVDIGGNIMGMIVDSVSEVLRLPASTIEPPPEIVTGINSDYIKGVAKLDDKLLIFLDLSKVIDVNEMSGVGA